MTKSVSPPTIEQSPPIRWAEVLRLLHLGQQQILRLLDAQRRGYLDMEGLFSARRGHRLVGAAWGQQLAGKSAFCWPVGLAKDEPLTTANLLQQAVDHYLDSSPVAVTQAVLPHAEGPEADVLRQAGYQYLTDLAYLAWPAVPERPGPPDPEDTADRLWFEPVGPHQRREFGKLIEATYTGSLDCPQLDGRRSIDDVMVGYAHTGLPRWDWWLWARWDSRPVGCLILTDHPNHEQAELIYLGILPEFRGRGWGDQLTRHAQRLTRQAGRERLVLAVDQANWPALRMYRRAAFGVWDRRSVFVRFQPAQPPRC
jgi:ribosomal protein S18 acetylase RimI-like enzyme